MSLRSLRRGRGLLSRLSRVSAAAPRSSASLLHFLTPSPPSAQFPAALQLQSRLFRTSRVLHAYRGSNDDDIKIGPDTILFEGCDYNHWLITMDFPKDPKPTPEEMVDTYVQTLAKGLNISIAEAKLKMYACSTTTYQGFNAVMTEEESKKFEGLPGVVFILPDSYIDPVNKEYGGDKYINGTIIPRPLPSHYGAQRRPRTDERSDRPRRGPPPNSNYAPPSQYDIPSGQNYAPPRQNYGPPRQNFGPPGQNFGPPGQNFGPPGQAGQNFGPPGQAGQNFGPPGQVGQNFGPPGQAGQNFGPPGQAGQNFGPPGQAGQNFGPPGQAGQNFGPPGQAGQNFGPPGQAGQNFGPPGQAGQNYGPPMQNYNPAGQAVQNYNPAGQAGQNYSPPGQAGQNYSPPGQAGPNYRPPGQAGQNYRPPGQAEQNYGPPGQFYGSDQRSHGSQGDQKNYATMGQTGPNQG